jgi:hypothetical protein
LRLRNRATVSHRAACDRPVPVRPGIPSQACARRGDHAVVGTRREHYFRTSVKGAGRAVEEAEEIKSSKNRLAVPTVPNEPGILNGLSEGLGIEHAIEVLAFQ